MRCWAKLKAEIGKLKLGFVLILALACCAFGDSLTCNGIDQTARSDISHVGTPFSLAVWVKFSTDTTGIAVSIADKDSTSQQYRIGWDTEKDKFYADIFSGSYLEANRSEISHTYDGEWHHLVGVYASPTSRLIYLDGVAGTENTNSDADATGIDQLSIAVSADSTPVGWMDGLVESPIPIYHYALTASEVAALYQKDAKRLNFLGAHDTSEVLDLSGNVHNGTPSDSDILEIGDTGWQASTDGVDQYIRLGYSGEFDFGASDFSVATWVYRPVLGANWRRYFFGKWTIGSNASSEWMLHMNGGGASGTQPAFAMCSGSTSYSAASTNSTDNETWYHLAGIREGESIYLYVDGVLAGSNSVGSVSVNDVGGLQAWIGQVNSGYYTEAIYDNTRIYNRSIRTDVGDLYDAGRNAAKDAISTNDLAGFWDYTPPPSAGMLVAPSWPDARVDLGYTEDSTDHGQHAYITNTPTWVSDTGSPYYSFDDAAPADALVATTTNLYSTGDFSWGAWVKFDSDLGHSDNVYGGRAGIMRQAATRFVYLSAWDKWDLAWESQIHSFEPAGTGEWVHVAISHDISAKLIRSYTNGVLVNSQTLLARYDTANPTSLTATVYFGGNPADNPATCGLDDIRYYGRYMTEDDWGDIATNYARGLAPKNAGGYEDDLLAFYSFNQGEASENALTEIPLDPNLPDGAAATNAWQTKDGQHTITPYGGPIVH